jgi:hypothetical protein
MTNKNDPAYPASANQKGLTKREAFAMHALQGMLALAQDKSFEQIAIEAVRFADLTIARLKETDGR